MKKFLQTKIIAIILLSFNVFITQAQGVWTQKTDFGGTARRDAVGCGINTKGYIGTGNDGSLKKDFWEYNQVTDSWTQKADFGGGNREKASCFAIGTKLYVACGNDAMNNKKDCWEFNPGANTWTQKADLGGDARCNAMSFSIGTKGYITCGNNGITYKKDCWEYNAAGDSWTQVTDFPGTARERGIAFTVNNKGYCGTGWDTTFHIKKDMYEYNQGTNTWTAKANFGGTARYDACGFNIGNKGYVGCGYDGSATYKNDFWEYDYNTDSWSQQNDFGGTGRYRPVGFGLGAKGYIGTGTDYTLTSKKDFWEFAPCDVWNRKADFPGTARAAAFGFAIGNKGYMGTGFDGISPETKDVWEYNPATDTWTQMADFGGTARHSTFSFAIGTKGYVGGGFDGAINNNDFWEYSQASNTWTVKSSFPGAGRIDALGLAINGKGYAGTGNTGALQNDWYEYTPGTDSWVAKTNFPGTPRSQCAGFVIGSFGYMGTGFDGAATKDFYKYDPALNIWTAVADCGILNRRGAVGFTLCNRGYVVTGQDGSGNLLKEFWEYNPGSNTWTQKIDFGGSARVLSSAFVIGCKAYVGLGQITGPAFSNELWEYTGCCCSGGGGVGGGGGGGVETKSIGDITSKKIFANAVNSISSYVNYATMPLATTLSTTTTGANDGLSLTSLIPQSISNRQDLTGQISSPAYLTNITNAVEVLSIDYTNSNICKAVALGTKTIGEVYTHTKPVCDRLKNAELLGVSKTQIGGYNFIKYVLRQCDGNTEYAISFTAGKKAAANKFTIQSQWLNNNYTSEDTMYNFQVWCAESRLAETLVNDILVKLKAIMPIQELTATTTDIPSVYITSGNRSGTSLMLNVQNLTANTSCYFELTEKTNELAGFSTRVVPFTINANANTFITIPMDDKYECTINMYVNGSLADVVYMNDGGWNIDYNKNLTTINSFSSSNESSPSVNANEYSLYRNVQINATTKDYVNIYKIVRGDCGEVKNLTDYNHLNFNANLNGVNNIKVILVKKGITDWANQYSFTVNTNSTGFYSIALDNFLSAATTDKIIADDITALLFSVENNGSNTISGTLSNVKFTNQKQITIIPAINTKAINIHPNPASSKFTARFISENDQDLIMKIIDISTGSIVHTKLFKAVKGTNNVAVDLSSKNLVSRNYIITLEGSNGINYEPKKLMIDRAQ